MLEPRIQQYLFESADLVYLAAEGLASPVALAAQSVVGCLTAGGKLLVCGQGGGDALAQLLCQAMLGRFERERPGLAALPLVAGLAGTLVPGAERQGDAADVPANPLDEGFALQVRALGQPGDLLLVFCTSAGETTLTATAQEAHAQDMSIIALTPRSGGALAPLLQETDIWISVPQERAARVQELHLLALHALCDAIDLQLLGEVDPP
jgi:D-sedoheptulose 7-phosphate isomerase